MAMMTRFNQFFDIPADAAGDLPRITLIARQTLLLQGRQRLLLCQSERMVFATMCGRLFVDGEDLVVSFVDSGETCLCGKIDRISFLADEL
ncbi:MAG: hypothetical protein J6L88_00565 [Clostridia bacterium]|nr:hypothetical protein [Clostridia bacterium]